MFKQIDEKYFFTNIADKLSWQDLYEIFVRVDRAGVLEPILRDVGLENVFKSNDRSSRGKIFVCGGSSMCKNDFRGIIKDLGVDPRRFDFCFDYQNLDKRLAELQYNPDYVLIMAGPMPHSGSIKGKCGSMIAALESMEGYPKVVRLEANGKLKITKSNFRTKLQEQIDAGMLAI